MVFGLFFNSFVCKSIELKKLTQKVCAKNYFKESAHKNVKEIQ